MIQPPPTLRTHVYKGGGLTLKRHTWTLATVIRAGVGTALVSLDDWHRGQILARRGSAGIC